MSLLCVSRRSFVSAMAGALFCVAIMLPAGPASAAAFRIVALGASNTNGKGVSGGEAFPAQIEAMLRANGVDASVSVSATNGDDSSQLLARVDSSAPDGTALVLIEAVQGNDRKAGISDSQHAANLATIRQRLAQRKIKSIIVLLRPLPPDGLQADGEHLTAHGHQAVAARYLPQVMAALKAAR